MFCIDDLVGAFSAFPRSICGVWKIVIAENNWIFELAQITYGYQKLTKGIT